MSSIRPLKIQVKYLVYPLVVEELKNNFVSWKVMSGNPNVTDLKVHCYCSITGILWVESLDKPHKILGATSTTDAKKSISNA